MDFTCKWPPWQSVAFSRFPTLNFLKRKRKTKSRGAPFSVRKRYVQVNGRPTFCVVTSGELTSSNMSTVLLHWSFTASAMLPPVIIEQQITKQQSLK